MNCAAQDYDPPVFSDPCGSIKLVPHLLMIRAEMRQFRFPRSKKKRIRKKWAKRTENFRPMPAYFMMRKGDTIFVHPDIIEKLTNVLKTTEKK